MKATVPETGTVIRLDGDMAVVLLNRSKPCKGCGAAAIGLCNPSGSVSTFTVKNTKSAVLGDTVKITLDKSTQRKGFLLAYSIPIAALLGGALLGYFMKDSFAIPSLDVITGFTLFLLASLFSFGRLKQLNGSSSMTIKEIVRDYQFTYQEPGQTHPQ